MKMLALIAALLLAASPVAAQQQQQPLGAGGRTNNSTHPNTRRYLPGTDDRDVLQRNHQPEQWRLWFRVPVPHRARLASPRLLRLFRPARRFRQPTNYATNNNIRGALVDLMRNHWPTAHDEASAVVFDGPWGREVARGHPNHPK